MKYQRDENQLYIFVDDCVPHWLTSSIHIDFDTIACGGYQTMLSLNHWRKIVGSRLGHGT